MIMVPVLIMQIFIFPFTATVIMNTWMDSRRTLELQETAGNLGSSIQQLYYTINQGAISNGTMRITLDLPPLLEGLAYTTTLHHVTHSDTSYEIMNVTLRTLGTNDQASTIVTLGQNVDWKENSAFNSTSQSLSIIANKTLNSIWISFGGGP